MKGLKILINIILDIMIFVLVIGILLAMSGFVQTKIMKKAYSNYFGYTYFQILTGSMEDTIHVDDVVFVRITDNINEEDIVSFVKNGEVITHRVIEKKDEGFVTKGDNNNAADGLIEKDKVIGKVVYIGKSYGKLKKFILEPIVIIPFISVVILFSWYLELDKKERSFEDEK